MTRSKVKVSTKPGRSGQLLAKAPVLVKTTSNAAGSPIHSSRAHIGVHIRTTHDGKPRPK